MGLFATAEDKIKSKKLKEEGCVVTLQVEVPAAKVQDATQTALVRYQSQARLPGFRPGKAPIDLVRKQFADAAREKALDQLVRETLPEAFKENQVYPVATPSISSIKMDPGQPLVFQVEAEVSPKVQAKNYKKLPVTRKQYPASDEDITKRLDELREGNARLDKALQETLEKSHYAVVDYEAFADGKALRNGKGTDELIDLSAPGTAEGLTDGLIGAKRGDFREIPVKIQGKPATFKVTVKEIKTKILPNVDDEFAKDLGYDSILALRGKLREMIEDEGKHKTEREVMAQIEEGLLKGNSFPIPPTLAGEALERMLDRFREQVLGPKRDWPEEEKNKLREKLKPKAENEVRLSYLLRAVAQAEKIEATPQDFESEKEQALKTAESESDREKIAKYFEERKDGVLAAIQERKTIDFLKNAATITEA